MYLEACTANLEVMFLHLYFDYSVTAHVLNMHFALVRLNYYY